MAELGFGLVVNSMMSSSMNVMNPFGNLNLCLCLVDNMMNWHVFAVVAIDVNANVNATERENPKQKISFSSQMVLGY